MKTKTQKHKLTMPTVALAATLKRIEARPWQESRQVVFLCRELRRELEWRAAMASVTV